jgi:hypothetical protein
MRFDHYGSPIPLGANSPAHRSKLISERQCAFAASCRIGISVAARVNFKENLHLSGAETGRPIEPIAGASNMPRSVSVFRLPILIVVAALAPVAAHAQTYTTIDDPLGAHGTYVEGLSGGTVVGFYVDSVGHTHGFSYDGSAYTTIDNPLGVNGTYIHGIDGGIIVGSDYDNKNALHGFRYDGTTSPRWIIP